MVEEVEVTNFGKGGVASEETLADLLKAVEYLAKKEGFDPKKTAEKVKKLGENLDDTIDVIDENRKAIEENTDALEDSTKSYNRVFGLLGSALGAVGTSLFNFSAELIDGGSTLSDFAQHIPVFGSIIARVTGYFDDTMTVFRDIASVGGAMNNSLIDIRMAAAQTFMSLDEFRNFVVSNSAQLAVMGGTVTKGVKRLTELNAALGDQRLELLNLGYSYQEINDALVRYAYLDRAGRRAQQVNAAQQAAAAADYAKNLSTLSKLTGKEIESIEEKVQANTQDVAFQQKLAKMSPQERAKVLNAMAEATEIYGDAGAQFFKQQILGMPPLTEETQMLAAAFPDLANQIRGLAADAQDTRISLDQFNQGSTDRLIEAVRAAAEAGEDFDTLLAAGAAGLDGPASALANILQGMGVQFTDFIENGVLDEDALRSAVESAKSETETRNKLTNSLLEFEDSIRKARQEILTNFIDSGVFDLISDTVQSLSDTISDPRFIGALKDAIIDVTNFISGFIEDVKSDGFKTAILNAFKDIGQVIKDFLFGVTGQERQERATQEISAISDQIAQLQSEKTGLMSGRGQRDPAAQAEIERQMALIDQRIARLNESAQEQQGILATPVEELNQEGILSEVGSMIVGAGTTAITEGFKSIFSNETLVDDIAVGIAGIWASSKVVSAAANAVSGIRDLFGVGASATESTGNQRRRPSRASRTTGGAVGQNLGGVLGGLSGGLLEGAAAGLKAFANPKILIGSGILSTSIVLIGGAVAGATWMLGAALPTFAEGMKSFEDIDGEALSSAGSGMLDLSGALAAFGAASVVSGIGNLVGNIADGLGSLIGGDDPLEKLKRFSETSINYSQLEQNLDAMDTFSSTMSNMSPMPSADVLAALKTGIVGLLGGETDPFAPLKKFSEMTLGPNTEANATALKAYADAVKDMPNMPSSSVFEAFKNGIVSLLGGETDPFAPLKKFSEMTLGPNTEANATALKAYADAVKDIPNTPSSSVFDALKNGIVSLLGGETDPFAPMVRFSNMTLGPNTEANANAVMSFANAMSNMPSMPETNVFEALKNGIVDFLGGETDPFAPMVRFSNMTLGPNTEANANAVMSFANAIQNMPQIDTGRSGGALAAIGEWFTGSDVMPWDAVKEFGSSQLDPQGYITANAEAITKFGTALGSFPQELSSIEISKKMIDGLEALSLITGQGITNIADGLTEFVEITGIQAQLDTINNGFDPTGVRTYATAIDSLVDKMNDLNEVLAESNDTLFKDNMSAAEVLSNINVSTQGNTEGLNQLNSIMTLLHEEIVKNNDLTKKIERNTKSFGRDIATGRVSEY